MPTARLGVATVQLRCSITWLCVALLVASAVGQDRRIHEQSPVRLEYFVGMRDAAETADGVWFRIDRVAEDGTLTALAEHHRIEPGWQPEVLDLEPFRGETIVLRFTTDPGPSKRWDWACWGNPRIVVGGEVVERLVRTRPWRTGCLTSELEVKPLSPEVTGAMFQPGRASCDGVVRPAIFTHPPFRGDAAAWLSSFGEFRVTLAASSEPEAAADPVAGSDGALPPPLPGTVARFRAGQVPCFRREGPIRVDGSLDDWPELHRGAALEVGDWDSVVEYFAELRQRQSGWAGEDDCSGTYFFAWDDENLYVAEVRRDDLLHFSDSYSPRFSRSDSLGIVLGPADGDDVTRLSMLPIGERNRPMLRVEGTWMSPDMPRCVHRMFRDGWITELAIPFSALGIDAGFGDRLTLDVDLGDSDSGGYIHGRLSMAGSENGQLVLCDRHFAWLECGRRVFVCSEPATFTVHSYPPGPVVVRGVDDESQRVEHGQVLAFVAAETARERVELAYEVETGGERFASSFRYQTVAPGAGLRGADVRSSVQATEDGGYALVAAATGETLEYRIAASRGIDVAIVADGDEVFRTVASQCGPTLVGVERAAVPDVSLARTPSGVRCSVVYAPEQRVVYDYRLDGRILVIDVHAEGLVASEFHGPLRGMSGDAIEIPYLPDVQRPFVLTEGRFIGAWADWTTTGATSLAPGGSTIYAPRTDATRNRLRETVRLIASRDLLEVVPRVPNPVSPYRDLLADKVVLDCWSFGGTFGQFDDVRELVETLAEYRVEHVALIQHVWQWGGYDNALPQHFPANESQGGEEGLRRLVDAAIGHGFLFALHESYRSYYENYPSYNERAIALDSSSLPQESWFAAHTGRSAFKVKPDWMLEHARSQTPEIQSRYRPTAGYVDALSNTLPRLVDCDHEAPGAASMSYEFGALRDLFSFVRETHGGPVFGEGSRHAPWVGLVDGCEAQIGWAGGSEVPYLVDYDLDQLHPLAVNHGMGYYPRWHRERRRAFTSADMTQYRAAELAYGHAGFIHATKDAPGLHSLTQTLREYHLVQPLQAIYARAEASSVGYLFDDVPGHPRQWVGSEVAGRTNASRKVRVAYGDALTLWVNDGRDWSVRDRVLPPYGFVAEGPGITAWTARTATGAIVDYVETAGRVFVDPRTYDAPYDTPGSGELRAGDNARGTRADFGSCTSDFAFVMDRSATALRLMPIPHGHEGTVELRLDRLAAGLRGEALVVRAYGSTGALLRETTAHEDAGVVTLRTDVAAAVEYAIEPR